MPAGTNLEPSYLNAQPVNRQRGLRWWNAAVVLVVVAAVVLYPIQVKQGLYTTGREIQRMWTITQIRHLSTMRSNRVTLRYPPEQTEDAALVLEIASQYYPRLQDRLGVEPQQRALMIMHPDRSSMREVFGWSSEDRAMGVYWSGTVQVLSPSALMPGLSPDRRAWRYEVEGPVVHELTHLLLDQAADGHYPAWFSEGLAQFMEWQYTGWQWTEGNAALASSPYGYDELQDFRQVSNQAKAYRQSFLMVRYISKTGGRGTLSRIIEQLAAGVPFATTLEQQTGMSEQELMAGWQKHESIPGSGRETDERNGDKPF